VRGRHVRDTRMEAGEGTSREVLTMLPFCNGVLVLKVTLRGSSVVLRECRGGMRAVHLMSSQLVVGARGASSKMCGANMCATRKRRRHHQARLPPRRRVERPLRVLSSSRYDTYMN
jgi:hypothetical protein